MYVCISIYIYIYIYVHSSVAPCATHATGRDAQWAATYYYASHDYDTIKLVLVIHMIITIIVH